MEAWLSHHTRGDFWCSFAATFQSDEPRLTSYDTAYASSIKILNMSPKAFLAAYGPYFSAAMSDLAEALATILAISRSRVRIQALYLEDARADGRSADEVSWCYEILPDPFLRETTARDAFLLVNSNRVVQNRLQELYLHQVLRYRLTAPKHLYSAAVFRASLVFPRPKLADYLAARDEGQRRVFISGVKIALSASAALPPLILLETFGTMEQLCAFLRTRVARTLRVWPHRVEVEHLSNAGLPSNAGGPIWGAPLVQLTLLAPDEVSGKTHEKERTLLDMRRELLPSLYCRASSINSDLQSVLEEGLPGGLPFPLLGAPAGSEMFTVQELVAISRRLGGKAPYDPLQPQDVEEMLSFFGDRLLACSVVFRISLRTGPGDARLAALQKVVGLTLSQLLGMPDRQLFEQSFLEVQSAAGGGTPDHTYKLTVRMLADTIPLPHTLRRLVLMSSEIEEKVDESTRLLLPSTSRPLRLKVVTEVISPLLDLVEGLSFTVVVSGVGHPRDPSMKKMYLFDFAFVVAHHLNILVSGEPDSPFSCNRLRLKDPLGRATVFRCEDIRRSMRFFPVTLPQKEAKKPHPAALEFERNVCKWVRQRFSGDGCATAIHSSVRFEQLKYTPFDSYSATWIQVTGVGYDEVHEAYSMDTPLLLSDFQHALAKALSPAVSPERVVVSKVLPVSQTTREAPAITFRVFLLPDALLSATSTAEAALLLRSKRRVQEVLRVEYLDKKLSARLHSLRPARRVAGPSSMGIVHAEPLSAGDDLDRVLEDVIIWRLSATEISEKFGTIAHFGQYVRAAIATGLDASFDRLEVIKVFDRREPLLQNVSSPWSRLGSGAGARRSCLVVQVAIRSADDTGDVLDELQHPRLLQLLLERKLRRRTERSPISDRLLDGLQHAFGEKRLRVSARPSKVGG